MSKIFILIGDIFVLLAAMLISTHFSVFSQPFSPESRFLYNHAPDLLMIISVYIITFYKMGLYSPYRHRTRLELVSTVFSSSLLAALIYLSLAFLSGLCLPPRNQSILFVFSSITLFLIYRLITYYGSIFIKRQGNNLRNILIIGSFVRAQEVIDALKKNKMADYQIIGCMEIDKKYLGKNVCHGIKVIGTMDEFYDFLLNNVVDEIIFAIPLSVLNGAMDYLSFADDLGIRIKILPNWQLYEMAYRPRNAIIIMDTTANIPGLSLSSTPQKAAELILKDATDIIGAVILLLLTAPMMILIALGVKISSPGPIFFRQTRMGLNGRKFTIYKFRTMHEDADAHKEDLRFLNEQDGPAFKITNDPRITNFGRFLRRTSLDELPQLFNIIKGEMSLVGPRPALPEEVDLYKLWQRRRLAMKPGMTCIWQVYARNKVDFDTWMKLDLLYIDNWSYFLDLKLIFLTIPLIFKMSGR